MTKKLYWWSLIAAVLFLTVQFLAIVIYIYSFIPLVWDDTFLKGLEPNRDLEFFAIFLFTSVVLTAMAVIWVLPKLNLADTRRKFRLWLAMEGVWCFLMVFCFFKWTTYRYPFWNVLAYENSAWLQPFFCVVCGLAILSKVFFPEIEGFYRRMQIKAGERSFPGQYIIALQIVFIAGVVLLLYIPRPEDVTALALVWDQWNHLDSVTGWFLKNGWSISYDETIQILVMMAIVYIIGLFYFIRLWLKSWFLAMIGALLAIKLGMFYYGTAPCIWIYPAKTFLAHGWDIILFFGLWYVSEKHPGKFYAAASLIGVALIVGWFRSYGYIDALGLDDQPMMVPLKVRQFFPFFMGYFVPLFYVFNLLILMGRKNTQNAQSLRLPVVICIYGLMIFVDYLMHPLIGYYGSLMVPAILIMLWWGRKSKRGVLAGVLLLTVGALLTNRLMLTYPNILFQDKDRFARERSLYENFDKISQSASLIRQLTREDEKVVLISNFETALLMQADRKPFFKDFPVMFSALGDNAGGLNLKTAKQCIDMIDSMTKENPLYVFVDDRLWAMSGQVMGRTGAYAVFNYLHGHYQNYSHEGFLEALQRK